LSGKLIDNLTDKSQAAGSYEITWQPRQIPTGLYFAAIRANGQIIQTIKVNVVK
jgi:hypothetical protein